MPTDPSLARQQVQASNARIDGDSYPRTAVFVGGTSGIGEAAIRELVQLGNDRWPARIYVVGREQSAARVGESLDRLRAENPGVELIWTPGDVSLLADVERVCLEMKAKETSLDLLWFSTGYAPLGGREETKEGLIITHVLGYHSRVLFMRHLLPLLKASPAQGRVVSVFAGGRETTNILLDDLNLEKPANFSWYKCQFQSVTMLSVAMEHLAEENTDVTFIHASPGLVKTGNLNRGWRGRWLFQLFMNVVLAPFFLLCAFSIEESQERMLYLITSAKYGGHGVPLLEGVPPGLTTRGEETGSLFLATAKCATIQNEKVMGQLRKEAKGLILAKTTEVLQPYLPKNKA